MPLLMSTSKVATMKVTLLYRAAAALRHCNYHDARAIAFVQFFFFNAHTHIQYNVSNKSAYLHLYIYSYLNITGHPRRAQRNHILERRWVQRSLQVERTLTLFGLVKPIRERRRVWRATQLALSKEAFQKPQLQDCEKEQEPKADLDNGARQGICARCPYL